MTPPELLEPPGGPDPDVAAAELALGLLEGDDRATALRRQLADPAFARDVERWREHFATLFAGTAERVPPADLVEQIEAHLDRPPGVQATASPGFWRPLALASMLAAASLAGVAVIRTETPSIVHQSEIRPQMIAALAHQGSSVPLAAYYDPASQLVRMPGPMPIPTGRSAQLWAIESGKAPIPLGLFRIVGATVVADARGHALMHPGMTLAISLEPAGGSRTGKPTGPVVASGALSQV
ncbi:MAG: anti-sigma factor [Pseudomonadota bacterium]|nr:anti-sigma factor [Pseudomonadota bacterium]